MSAARYTRLIGCGLIFSAAVFATPSAAGDTITLRVPVQLKEMVALGARVDCQVFGTQHQYAIGSGGTGFAIPDGEYDAVVEVVVLPGTGSSLIDAASYRCKLLVSTEAAAADGEEPYPGTPVHAGASDYRLAKPTEFFQSEVTGQINSVAIPGGGGQLLAPAGN